MKYIAVTLTTLALCASVPVTAQAPHPHEFWKAIIEQSFEVPKGASAPALAAELSGMLGSADPDERDGFGYTILTQWIFAKRVLQPAEIRPAHDRVDRQSQQRHRRIGHAYGASAIFFCPDAERGRRA